MESSFTDLAALASKQLSFHILSREEGHIWTTPQDSINGSFVFPRTFPLTFREGSSINISWSKTYETINLYFYQRGKVANSVQLVTNLATDWYQWEVRAEETDLTNPFVFRAVNAQGTIEEQSGGGFWSTSWYLARSYNPSESAISLSSIASSTTITTLTTSSSPAVTSSEILSPTTTQGTKSEATATPSTAAETHGSGFDKGAIIGLTVGLVIAGAIIIAGLFYYLRKRQKSKVALSSAPLPASFYYDKAYIPTHPEHQPVHEAFAQPSELQGVSPCYELPGKKEHGS